MLLCNYPNPPATHRVKLKLKHPDLADPDVLIPVFHCSNHTPSAIGCRRLCQCEQGTTGNLDILLASQFLEEPQTTPLKIRPWAG